MYGYIFFEIQADDPQRAQRFYANVFGWKFERQHGPINYWQIITGGNNGGLMKRPLPRPSADHGANAFVCSVEVDDFDDESDEFDNESGGEDDAGEEPSAAEFAALDE